MRGLVGAGMLAATVALILLLRPRNGREKRLLQLPGMWIVLGLLLTISAGTGVALIVTGVNINW